MTIVFVVDASVWVSRFVPNDLNHDRSLAWLHQCMEQGSPIVSPALTLAEIAGVIARQTRRPNLGLQAATLVQRLPNTRLVPVGAELAQLVAETAAYFRLRGSDALYVALARRLGIPLVTWDQEQLDRGGEVIAAQTPRE